MVHLIADEIALDFPLFSTAHLQAVAAGEAVDDRLRVDDRGRVLSMRALDGISFSLKSGDRLGIVGRNGSGKTTLLRVLAEILSPSAGTLRIDGRSTNLININLGIQPGATAHRNITLRGLAAGRSVNEIEARRAEIVDFAELGSFIDFPVDTYSAGMRMRLNFAITTAFDPEILILDEWLSTGDLAFRAKATARMKEFVAKAGILILASHNKKLLDDNCNRALWIDQGRIRMDGDVDTVWSAYAEAQKEGGEATAQKPELQIVAKQAATE